jgi:ubiquinone/menaquinone biosynthesis C-methylase UbiE
MKQDDVRRLHFGCGWTIAPGWINSDILQAPGIDVSCDIRKGLPLADDTFDYVAAHHAMQDLKIYEQVDALKELRRVLKPGGVLRLGLPDFDKFVAAYQRGDGSFFFVHDWDTIDGNFFTHLLWYNITQTPMTSRFMEELLRKAGFSRVEHVRFKQTRSRWAEIAELDGREAESFYVEAWK